MFLLHILHLVAFKDVPGTFNVHAGPGPFEGLRSALCEGNGMQAQAGRYEGPGLGHMATFVMYCLYLRTEQIQ